MITRKITMLFLLCTVLFFGCGPKQAPTLYIYCNETFWYVVQEEAFVFSKAHGFRVVLIPIRAPQTAEETLEIDGGQFVPRQWRSEPGKQAVVQSVDSRTQIHEAIERQIDSIATINFGDLFLSDSQKQLEKLRQTALAASEFPICYLTLTMIVPQGNPHQFRSINDVLASNRQLGIVDPTLDGLGEASWTVLSRIIPGGESAIPMELVQLYDRQYDLLEALEQRQIDAALVWNATSLNNFLLIKYADEYNTMFDEELREVSLRRNQTALQHVLREIYKILIEEKSFAEEVPLSENPDERQVVVVRLFVLSSTSNYDYSKRFADFMRSNQAKDILRRVGFVVE